MAGAAAALRAGSARSWASGVSRRIVPPILDHLFASRAIARGGGMGPCPRGPLINLSRSRLPVRADSCGIIKAPRTSAETPISPPGDWRNVEQRCANAVSAPERRIISVDVAALGRTGRAQSCGRLLGRRGVVRRGCDGDRRVVGVSVRALTQEHLYSSRLQRSPHDGNEERLGGDGSPARPVWVAADGAAGIFRRRDFPTR